MIRSMAMLLVLCFAASSEAVTRYVSTSGSDGNSCAASTSLGNAKRNLNGTNGGIACMSAGDVLEVDDGTYNEIISDIESTPATRPPNGTSWENLTVIKSRNFRGATLNKPSPDPPGSDDIVVFLGLPSTQYISVEDFVIDGRGHGMCTWIGSGSHQQIKGNVIKNCGGNGLYGAVGEGEAGGEDQRIINNEFFNVSLEELTPPGQHCLYFTGKYSLIQGNLLHGCPFYGIHVTSELGGIFEVTVENNRVYGARQAGIIMQGSNNIIRNNLLENNCIGIQLNNPAKVYNNTIFDYQTTTYCPDSFGIYAPHSAADIRNNLILQQFDWDLYGTYIYSGEATPNLENNMCDGVNPQNCQVNVADYTTVVVNGILSASETPGASDLRLKSGSAAINAGVTLSTDVPLDRLGVARPQGSAFDIGAYEFSAGGDVTAPTVSITSPSSGATVSGTISVTATASDDVGVFGVQFKVGGSNIGAEDTVAPYAASLNTTTVGNGTHLLTAVARDAAGNSTTSAAVSITVNNADSVPPTVSVTAPLPGAVVSGIVAMDAIASDDVGVIDVQFKVDGGNVDIPDVGPSYNRTWDTTGYSDGAHSVTAVARDAVNSTTSTAVNVTVMNGTGGGVVAKARRVYQW